MLALALEQVSPQSEDDEAGYVYARTLAEQAAFLNALGHYKDAIAAARAAVTAVSSTAGRATAVAQQAGGYPAAAGTLQWGMA